MTLRLIRGYHCNYPIAYCRVLKLSHDGRVTRAEYGSTKTVGNRSKLYAKLRLSRQELSDYLENYEAIAIVYRVPLLALARFFAHHRSTAEGRVLALTDDDHRAIAEQMQAYRHLRLKQTAFRW